MEHEKLDKLPPGVIIKTLQLKNKYRVSIYMSIVKKSNITATAPFYTIGEEIANSILHGIGTLGAITGLVLLSLKTNGLLSYKRAGGMDIAAAVLFASTMIGMFLISTLYHAIQHRGAKNILRRLDHSVIFIFIAGTYTPHCLSGLRGAWGWSLFGAEWALAFLGITLNILDNKALKKVEVAAYIAMGWAIIVGFVPLLRSVPVKIIILLVAGGAAYTLGTIWYRMKSTRFTHVIWHFFVIIGAVCHWFSVWYLH
ncbi:MAG: hemolysin III family protein [Treponema sp.]|nr:hemolysin III family protein [Treponema sp.]